MKALQFVMKTKGAFTEEQKREIIRLYVEEKRGKFYIAKLFDRSDWTISYWLKKWGVETHSRSVIKQKMLEVYGPTKGFTGKKKSESSKAKARASMQEVWRKGRSVGVAKSCMHETCIGPVQGTWEVAYLQNLYEQQQPLPQPCRRRIKTPYGTYKPDFEFDDRFMEIKSPFTLQVAKGEMPDKNGVVSNNQWRKMAYVNARVKKVDVVVFTKTEARELFRRAAQGVLT